MERNEETLKTYRKVLSIAGSDSSGGAGIQADLKTFSALGCYGMTVITALTAQNTTGVTGVWPMDPDCVALQMDAVLDDIGADAVKIGMLWSLELAERVAARLVKHKARNVVFDPVMVAQSGDRLMELQTARELARCLSGVSTIITPNVPEASLLLGYDIPDLASMEQAARDLASWGFGHVLLKGGHHETEKAEDLLFSKQGNTVTIFESVRVDTKNNHGTGCTLSSAIASFLAHGLDLHEACRRAKTYITCALEHGALYALGHGHGPVHHFHGIWE